MVIKQEWSVEFEAADDADTDYGYLSFDDAMERAKIKMNDGKWSKARVMENTEVATLTRKVSVKLV